MGWALRAAFSFKLIASIGTLQSLQQRRPTSGGEQALDSNGERGAVELEVRALRFIRILSKIPTPSVGLHASPVNILTFGKMPGEAGCQLVLFFNSLKDKIWVEHKQLGVQSTCP